METTNYFQLTEKNFNLGQNLQLQTKLQICLNLENFLKSILNISKQTIRDLEDWWVSTYANLVNLVLFPSH